MDFFRELRELRGNKGREKEEDGVISAKPITMIVPPALQDLPERIMPESSAGSSAKDDCGDHHASPSNNSSSEQTPSHGEDTRDVVGNAPDLIVVGEWAALHHEVADNAPSISGYKKLEEMRLEIPAKAIVFRSLFQCRLCPNSRGAKWYYLSGREKNQLFKDVRNKVARWKRQLVFVRDMRTERINNDLVAQLFEWRLAMFGFVNVANQFTEATYLRGNADEPRTREVVQWALALHRAQVEALAPSARRRPREDTDSEDEIPLTRCRMSWGLSLLRRFNLQRITYPEGFSYVKTDCQPTMVQGMQSFVPPVDRQRAKSYVQQHGGQVVMIKLMDAFSYAVVLFESEQGARAQNSELSGNCKQLATKKASLVDDVNRLQGSEMATRAASTESRAEELASRNNELKEELERVRAEKESEIQATKDEAACLEELAKKAKAERNNALNELSSFKQQVTKAAQNLTQVKDASNKAKKSHERSVSIACAQGAEWLVSSAVFQDAVAVASANITTKIYNEIRGKELQHCPDFPIRELAFINGEDLDEEGKSLAPLADTTVRLRWELNEEGVPVWPPSVLEEGEDLEGLPSFDSWAEGAPVAKPELSSTPSSSQPTVVPSGSPVTAPAGPPSAQSFPACASGPPADVSMPVDLTDD
ncbi:hypothetical protein SLEP1_g16332 [Rubroshorea leprosula]|uniref:Uncharacterized protein n=1 Tax=Rubroshorea leprosula TaxID=152421 RepID=A0AAV5J263_9ROSI|nr:hypothetical protein SLEP1_g16332 [Rubroshorea leprosula]